MDCRTVKEESWSGTGTVCDCNVTYTYVGPALSDNLVPLHYLRADEVQQNRIVQYTLKLRQMLVDVVGQAYQDLEPVYMTSGNGLCTVAVNRRTNNESEVPQKRLEGMLNGPYDHDVPVLAVRNADYESKNSCFWICLPFHGPVIH